MANLVEDGVDVLQNLIDGHGVHFAAVVITGLDGLFEVEAGSLGGKGVCDGVASALLLLHPGETGPGDPDGAAADVEANIDGIGMAGGDGDDVGGPAAMQDFPAPAVGGVEIFVHNSFQRRAFWAEAHPRCDYVGLVPVVKPAGLTR